MKSPAISVIVPVYNTEQYLHRCVDSILAQSFTDFELLLIDDGSTDGSGAICDEYADKDSRVRVFHKLNGGVSSARNLGLDNAKGVWVSFCDSDDLPFEDWLANYEVDSDPDADLICQGFKTDKKTFGPFRNQDEVSFEYDGDAEGLTEQLVWHNAIGYPWCKIYRLDIIKDNNLLFDTNIKMREDEIFLYFYLYYVKRAISHNRKGYFYFMPDWSNKYGNSFEDEKYLNEQAKDALARLLRYGEFQCLQKFLINNWTYEMMLEFSHNHKRCYLKKIRDLVIKYPNSTRMSPYLKKIIIRDKTMTFSWIALIMHMMIKKILKLT